MRDQGVIVITAAGNEGADANSSAPGNCAATFNIAASTAAGGRAAYSNFGTSINLSAPGGDTCDSNDCGLISTGHDLAELPSGDWVGTNTHTTSSELFVFEGTSFAAPLVSAAAAILLEADPSLTPDQTLSTLTSCSRSFPAAPADQSTACTNGTCGSGLLDVAAAVESVVSGVACSGNGGGEDSGSNGECTGKTSDLFNSNCNDTGLREGGGGSSIGMWLLALMGLMAPLRLRHSANRN
ncbi:extracellular protease [gamma proteobacterium HTCC5015]|nr:extracellular protease [gamma proteobacterium HTCC5015]